MAFSQVLTCLQLIPCHLVPSLCTPHDHLIMRRSFFYATGWFVVCHFNTGHLSPLDCLSVLAEHILRYSHGLITEQGHTDETRIPPSDFISFFSYLYLSLSLFLSLDRRISAENHNSFMLCLYPNLTLIISFRIFTPHFFSAWIDGNQLPLKILLECLSSFSLTHKFNITLLLSQPVPIPTSLLSLEFPILYHH